MLLLSVDLAAPSVSAAVEPWYENTANLIAVVAAAISLVSIVVNIVMTIVYSIKNKKSLAKHRANEAEYQCELFLYQELIGNKIVEYLKYACTASTILRRVSNQVLIKEETGKSEIESAIEELDKETERFQKEAVYLIRGFSHEGYKKTEEHTTEFYDGFTDKISKLYSLKSDKTSGIQRILNSADTDQENYICKILGVVNELKPSLDILK